MTRRSAALALACLALAGCGGDGDDGDEPPEPAAWAGPPQPAADGTIAVEPFNDYLDSSEVAPDASPVSAATAFLGSRQEAGSVLVLAEQEGEAGPTAKAVATLDRLLDDSVRAVRYTLELERGDEGWRLTSARRDQRCHAGRGHQDFTPEPCV